MNKIFLIIQREYLSRVMNKRFLLTTILMPILMVGFFAGVTFLSISSKDEHKIAVIDNNGYFKGNLQNTKGIHFEFPDRPSFRSYAGESIRRWATGRQLWPGARPLHGSLPVRRDASGLASPRSVPNPGARRLPACIRETGSDATCDVRRPARRGNRYLPLGRLHAGRNPLVPAAPTATGSRTLKGVTLLPQAATSVAATRRRRRPASPRPTSSAHCAANA